VKHQSYTSLIRHAVRAKWATPELKEWWYGKLSAARRRKTVKLFHSQDGKCCFCGEQTFLDSDANALSEAPLPRKRLATLEHKQTQKSGGTDRMSNLAMACLGCNNARGVMLFEQFLELRSCPARWEAFLKRKVGIKGGPNSHAAREKFEKKLAKKLVRYQQRAWDLAVLFYLYPSLQPVFEAHVKRFSEQKRQRNEAKVALVVDKYA
jgi:5-methylcytosine-specific restriction endonuclease McrA